MRGFFSFIKGVLSEDGVTGSYSRCASATIVFCTVAWITFLVFRTRLMPDLTGPLAFLTGGVGIHMGINKASEIATAIKGTPPPPATPPTTPAQ
jgi:hypothetical protein